MQDQRRNPLRLGYVIFGLLCVALGFIGWVVPGMPGTVFFIIALWSFQKSSPRLEQWLLRHRIVGPMLRDWNEERSIRRSTKILAVAVIWICILVSMVVLRKVWVDVVLVACAIGVTWYLVTRKTKVETSMPLRERSVAPTA